MITPSSNRTTISSESPSSRTTRPSAMAPARGGDPRGWDSCTGAGIRLSECFTSVRGARIPGSRPGLCSHTKLRAKKRRRITRRSKIHANSKEEEKEEEDDDGGKNKALFQCIQARIAKAQTV